MKKVINFVENYVIHIYFDNFDSENYISERYIKIDNVYSAQMHQPHTLPPEGKYHLHFYNKNNKLFALNKDGTAHDQSHGVRIPNKIKSFLTKNYPDWDIPNNGIIESDNSIISVNFLLDIINDNIKILND